MSVEYNCLEQLQIVQSWHDYNFDVEVQHEVSGLQPDVDIAGLGVSESSCLEERDLMLTSW